MLTSIYFVVYTNILCIFIYMFSCCSLLCFLQWNYTFILFIIENRSSVKSKVKIKRFEIDIFVLGGGCLHYYLFIIIIFIKSRANKKKKKSLRTAAAAYPCTHTTAFIFAPFEAIPLLDIRYKYSRSFCTPSLIGNIDVAHGSKSWGCSPSAKTETFTFTPLLLPPRENTC